MVKVRINVILYESVDGRKFDGGNIIDLPEEEATRAIAANVASPVDASAVVTPKPADDFEEELFAETPKKSAKGR